MGKYLSDLDLRFSQTMRDAESAYSRGDCRTGAVLLYQMNFHLPPSASIEDLPNPSESIRVKGLRHQLLINEQYRDWYEKWAPRIYKAIAVFNQNELFSYAEKMGNV